MLDILLTVAAIVGYNAIAALVERRKMRKNNSVIVTYSKGHLISRIILSQVFFYIEYYGIILTIDYWTNQPFHTDQIFFINSFRIEGFSIRFILTCLALIFTHVCHIFTVVIIAGSSKITTDLVITNLLVHLFICSVYSSRVQYLGILPYFSALFWLLNLACPIIVSVVADYIAVSLEGLAYRSSHAQHENMRDLIRQQQAKKREEKAAKKLFKKKRISEQKLHQSPTPARSPIEVPPSNSPPDSGEFDSDSALPAPLDLTVVHGEAVDHGEQEEETARTEAGAVVSETDERMVTANDELTEDLITPRFIDVDVAGVE
ncbi:Integral membrane protein SYS1-related [Carpediemonas membranifera]|uniref:Integral membrane protein SYS1-related n=1 Tax=Carpediemonas membranifera TaxID=201153 RepID=A0A8J6E1N4_9EUKA|nr:Integral membrane protein SYS1-related [Carpediemonas membranifera]|eukprot:KAG9393683.1 Integral membrane protein SYS1-related [Carpediemonas membranifera]